MRLLFLIVLLGCGTAPTGLPSPDRRAAAIRTVERRLQQLDLPSPFAYSRVVWLEGREVALDEREPHGGCVSVTTGGPLPVCHMFVATDGMPPSRTAFSHEAVHCLLAGLRGDPDQNHEGPFWRFLPADLSAALESAGL